MFTTTRGLFILYSSRNISQSIVRKYSNKSSGDCRRALVDIPPKVDEICPKDCERHEKKKEGILHRIKLRVTEGGTNFGTPFRRLKCDGKADPKTQGEEKTSKYSKHSKGVSVQSKSLVETRRRPLPMPETRAGVQVAILGADTSVGQYVALLLKQCSVIKKLRLYEAKDNQSCECNRDLTRVVEDLKHINTNCRVQAFSCACYELEKCLQSSDIVLMLESAYVNMEMPLEKRFLNQAPLVKRYADAIAMECPKAFVIVSASPVDCMVPIVAETLKETGWYDPRKVLGSMALQEMRASTLAAKALCLEPRYTKVPCVGGTEGDSLVPLFSKAVEYFSFNKKNAEMLTDAVRSSPRAVCRADGYCQRSSDLSEAHALSGLVTNVAHGLLCNDIPRITGFVETDASQVISPARFIASTVELGGHGITKNLGLPKMIDHEMECVDLAINELNARLKMVHDWYCKFSSSSGRLDKCQYQFFMPRNYDRMNDCAYATIR